MVIARVLDLLVCTDHASYRELIKLSLSVMSIAISMFCRDEYAMKIDQLFGAPRRADSPVSVCRADWQLQF